MIWSNSKMLLSLTQRTKKLSHRMKAFCAQCQQKHYSTSSLLLASFLEFRKITFDTYKILENWWRYFTMKITQGEEQCTLHISYPWIFVYGKVIALAISFQEQLELLISIVRLKFSRRSPELCFIPLRLLPYLFWLKFGFSALCVFDTFLLRVRCNHLTSKAKWWTLNPPWSGAVFVFASDLYGSCT